MSAGKIADLLHHAAQDNLTSPLRNGQMLHLPGRGDLLVVGDLHNHQRNFQKVMKLADLDHHPERMVILQELIHGGPLGPSGEDCSLEMVVNTLHWARKFPGRIHFVLANHDLAQIQGLAIMKDGYDLTERFTRYYHVHFGKDGPVVAAAFRAFVLSLPLAIISVTGILFTHSLPGVRDMATFDTAILRRPLTGADYQRTGSIYQLVWGRSQNADVLNRLSKEWWVDYFVCGHQTMDAGHGLLGERLVIVDASHNHGHALKLDLARQYTLPDLLQGLVPLAGVA